MLAARLQRGDLVLKSIWSLKRVRSQSPPACAVLSLERQLIHPVELLLDVLHLFPYPIVYAVEIIVFRIDVCETDCVFRRFVALLRTKPADAASSLY